MEKLIIFDASSLISLSMNGLLEELKELRKIFKGKFIIPQEVKQEIIDKPLTIKRFELEALKLKQLLDEKIIELPLSIGIKDLEISQKTKEMLNIANKMFIGRGKEIRLIDSGEASCLALSRILLDKKISRVICVDERTTRVLSEKPENLKKLLEKKMHTDITLKEQNFKFFEGFKFIRSTELMYVAYKKNLVRLKGPRVLDALLYALKFKGAAISGDEIKEIKSL